MELGWRPMRKEKGLFFKLCFILCYILCLQQPCEQVVQQHRIKSIGRAPSHALQKKSFPRALVATPRRRSQFYGKDTMIGRRRFHIMKHFFCMLEKTNMSGRAHLAWKVWEEKSDAPQHNVYVPLKTACTISVQQRVLLKKILYKKIL